jgi:hypothetical protein
MVKIYESKSSTSRPGVYKRETRRGLRVDEGTIKAEQAVSAQLEAFGIRSGRAGALTSSGVFDASTRTVQFPRPPLI